MGTDISSANDQQLSGCILVIMGKLGVKVDEGFATDFEVIKSHIRHHYAAMTLEDLRLAFDMAINEKLDVDATHYQNFSCLYVSSILNSYKRVASSEMNILLEKKRKSKEEMEYTKAPMSNFSKLRFVAECKKKSIDNCSASLIPDFLYEWLNFSEKLTQERVNEFNEIALAIVNARYEKNRLDGIVNAKKFNEFKNMCKLNKFTGDFKIEIIIVSKKIAVYEWFKQR